MKAHDLAKKLLAQPDREIMILDSYNGGGHPRDINLGPYTHTINAGNEEYCCDCEERVGEEVTVIGYGCY